MLVKAFHSAFLDRSRVFQLFQVARQGATVLIAILLAKSDLSLGDIGQYEQLLFLGYTLTFFWLTGLLQGFVVLYPQIEDEGRRLLEKNAVGLFLTVAGGLLVLTWIFVQGFSEWLTGGVVQHHQWMLFSVFFFSYQISSLVEHIYLVRDQVRRLIQWMVSSTILILMAFLIPVWTAGSLEAGLIGLAGFGVFRLIWLCALAWPSFRLFGDARLRNWVKTSLPLMGYAITGGAAVVIDGWIINAHYQDAQIFALYRYGARELPFSLPLAAALGTAAITRLLADQQSGFHELRTRVARLSHLLFPVTALVMLTSPWWFVRVFNPDFMESTSIFNLYLLILISRMVFTGPILMSMNATRFIFVTGIFELAVNAGLSLIFIRYWGIQGVALATILAYAFEKLVHVVYLCKIRGIPPSAYIPFQPVAIYSILLILVYLIS